MSGKLESLLTTTFSFLLDRHGFRVIRNESADSFGNEILVLHSQDFALRFVLDRDCLEIEITSYLDPENWHDLRLVESFVSGKHVSDVMDPERLASFLSERYSEVKELFNINTIDKTTNVLQRMAIERARRLFPSAFS